ncbi:MAG TPA: nucleotidyl transferase, partial [Ktedonobacterales bacterium]
LRGRKGGAVVVPVSVPSVVERVAMRLGGRVVYVKATSQTLTSAASQDGVALVGDGGGVYGGGSFVFPQLHPAYDGMFALMKLLEALAKYDTKLSAVVDDLPPYYVVRTQVTCPWEEKGKVMRMLTEQYRSKASDLIDGVKIEPEDGEWVLIQPDADRPLFHVIAEAQSHETSQALVDKYARVVLNLQ